MSVVSSDEALLALEEALASEELAKAPHQHAKLERLLAELERTPKGHAPGPKAQELLREFLAWQIDTELAEHEALLAKAKVRSDPTARAAHESVLRSLANVRAGVEALGRALSATAVRDIGAALSNTNSAAGEVVSRAAAAQALGARRPWER